MTTRALLASSRRGWLGAGHALGPIALGSRSVTSRFAYSKSPGFTTAAALTSSISSFSRALFQVPPSTRPIKNFNRLQLLQCRHYWYIPTSWTELKLRMSAAAKKRTIQVHLLRDKLTARKDLLKRKYQEYKRNRPVRRAARWDKFQQAKIKSRAWMRRKWTQRPLRLVWKQIQISPHMKPRWYPTMRLAVTLTEYSQRDWFHPLTGRPVVSRDATGRFVNPWLSQSTDGVHSLLTLIEWRWQRLVREWNELFKASSFLSWWSQSQSSSSSTNLAIQPQQQPVVIKPQWITGCSASVSSTQNTVRMTWIGHNTCLLQQQQATTGTITLLTDPIFSNRASPFPKTPIGVPRVVPPACTVEELPAVIDICLVSHDHYDHLDYDSVMELKHKVKLWVVPLGVSEWLQRVCGLPAAQILEMAWWESVLLGQVVAPGTNDVSWQVIERHTLDDRPHRHPVFDKQYHEARPLKNPQQQKLSTTLWLTCLPAQHWGSRTLFDRNYRLWCSFACFFNMEGYTHNNTSNHHHHHHHHKKNAASSAVDIPNHYSRPNDNPFLFYFAGDTAVPDHFPLFEQVRDYLGKPVDLAALPIGAYEPVKLCRDAHMNPQQALAVHRALEARQSIGIHWGSFPLTEEPLDEPATWLRNLVSATAATEEERNSFVTILHGQTVEFTATAQLEPTSTTATTTRRKGEDDDESSTRVASM